ncbi:NPCBM/NEW2 domain-containing protein [Arthrobacter sp. H35-D1]|uniref:NPCBM/NEW2 domain-containing protein n=1 Tax=Arthrobacter sp. H35-D1 TaxID=3046202 RepID=UPI0024B8C493|nr:NPCBM/NEW2 domain-containing protein [Arthrobacter sp. H35-D1]MDJ0312089.1 glycoside hydrolase family 31 protein [Arthrobacter sp. H35-D1]
MGKRATAVAVAGLLAVGTLPALALSQAAVADPGTPISASNIKPEIAVDADGTTLGAISSYSQEGNVVTLVPATGAIRATFLDDGNFRLEATPTGEFKDPANTPASPADVQRSANIVVGEDDFQAGAVTVTEAGAVVTMATAKVKLEVNKSSGAFTLKRADGSVVWQESQALTFGANTTTQHLTPLDGEEFLGGGMQNGRVVHTGSTINISNNYNWADGGHPNAVPYYMTSAGYGVMRNTFAPGSYTFTADETTTHKEKRFDAYYFVGDYKENLDGYTKLTGRPNLPPVYGLEYGDADCYNRSNPDYSSSGYTSPSTPKDVTFDAVTTAKEFKAHDMPAGWMIINDGYGCEYTPDPVGYDKDAPYDPDNPDKGLGGTVKAIKAEANLKTGLWTQRSLTNQATEVGEDGIAMRKLDVAWVGEGYRLALTGCESAKSGIEDYSTGRANTLMVEGWAGSQRCGVQWTGDHSGNLDQARWGVPALAGATNSGQAFTTSDVDGIFGGSTESYVRDLQWKAFAPELYSMSGWAPTDKRPWLYGDTATEINRKYLQMRQELMPYIYSLAVDAHNTGVGMMRSMPLEFPADELSYTKEAETQFMLGSDYLVAPVSTNSDVRNGIVLPTGSQWVDYWTGTIYQGGQVINGYEAPLETLPMFVRAGSVVPQGELARNASLIPEDSAITVDVYPSGNSSFTMNEDDKVTREYKNGQSSTQEFNVTAPAKNGGDVAVTIGKRDGDYAGKAATRPYKLEVHSGSQPTAVTVGATELTKLADAEAFKSASTGWYYDGTDAGGTVHVKAGEIASSATATVTLKGASAVGGTDSDAKAAEVAVSLEDRVFQGQKTTASASFSNTGSNAKTDVVISPELPDGWTVSNDQGATVASVAAGATIQATFDLVPGAGAAAGIQTIGAKASYKDSKNAGQEVSGANQMYVAYGSLAGAFNNISVTTADGAFADKLGNFDGGKASFSSEQMKKAPVPAGGVTPGSTVSVDAGLPTEINYTWPEVGPDKKNAVVLNGQTIALSGQGTDLAVLGSSNSGQGASPEFTITYTDGTVQKQSVYFPNWLPQGDVQGAKVAIKSMGRNNQNTEVNPEYTDYGYQIYSGTLRLLPAKQLASVTLPVVDSVKLFDWQVVDFPLPDAPSADAFVSDLDWVSASNGYGVIGKDVANKDAADSPDVPLTVVDKTGADPVTREYDKGLGVHAPSNVSYYTGGQCSRFTSDIGLEGDFAGKIIFTVVGDGKQLYQSRTFVSGFAPEEVDVDLSGVSYLELHVDPISEGAIGGAHGVWGNAKVSCEADAPADEADPVTTATIDPTAPADSGWYTTAPSVSLSATDNVGVAKTQYKIGAGPWTEYTEAVTLPEGENGFTYRSSDDAGNIEEDKSTAEFKVDTQVPTVSAVVDADARTIAVEAADSGSGVATVEYSTDGGTTWQAYTAAIEAGDDGVSVAYRATDKAGLIAASTVDAVIAPVETTEPAVPGLSAPASVVVGAEFTVDVKDLVVGESYELWIHSDPVKLATVKAGVDGTASVKATIPAAFAAGAHELTLEREGSVVARTAIVVTAATVDPPVTETPDPTETPKPTETAKPSDPAKPSDSAGNNGNNGSNNSGGNNAGSNNADGNNADQNGDLASTGAKVLLPAGIALLLVLGGGVALVVTRRRRA